MVKLSFFVLIIIVFTSCNSFNLNLLSYNNDDQEPVRLPLGLTDSLKKYDLIYNKHSFSTKDTNIIKKKIYNQVFIDFIKLKNEYISSEVETFYIGELHYCNNFRSSLFLNSHYYDNDSFSKDIFLLIYNDSVLLSILKISNYHHNGGFGGNFLFSILKKNKVFKIKRARNYTGLILPPFFKKYFYRSYYFCKFILTDEGYVKELNNVKSTKNK